MSFFTKAVSEALMLFPNLNSHIEGEEIVVPAFTDIGIAVQTDKGLMVPVIRNTESMKLSEIEIKLSELATKAKSNRISIEEMNGGTFTITNGGVYGSMLSTPILNPPQSGILGMHNIIERPVVIDGQIVIRPMMYLALSYDHRIVDGKDSVSFLAKVREFVENPERMLITGSDPEKFLLDL
jgi:2-oxoglutarate dehydrogenase E2 component (dihydrolipoamide succinyltransferase)